MTEPSFTTILLTKNKIAFVNAEDLPRVRGIRWQAQPGGHNKAGLERWYVSGRQKGQRVWLNKLIAGAEPDQKVRHKNGHTLDFCRDNREIVEERPATPLEPLPPPPPKPPWESAAESV